MFLVCFIHSGNVVLQYSALFRHGLKTYVWWIGSPEEDRLVSCSNTYGRIRFFPTVHVTVWHRNFFLAFGCAISHPMITWETEHVTPLKAWDLRCRSVSRRFVHLCKEGVRKRGSSLPIHPQPQPAQKSAPGGSLCSGSLQPWPMSPVELSILAHIFSMPVS